MWGFVSRIGEAVLHLKGNENLFNAFKQGTD